MARGKTPVALAKQAMAMQSAGENRGRRPMHATEGKIPKAPKIAKEKTVRNKKEPGIRKRLTTELPQRAMHMTDLAGQAGFDWK